MFFRCHCTSSTYCDSCGLCLVLVFFGGGGDFFLVVNYLEVVIDLLLLVFDLLLNHLL